VRLMDNEFPGADELYDVFDEDGRLVGQATRKEVHADRALIHRAVHVLLFRSDGRLLMQKRVKTKDVAPGKWDTSVGGHVDAGEDYDTAARRELKYRSERESEDVRTYRLVFDGPVSPQWFEIEQVREWTVAEVDRAVGTGAFTRNFEQDWELYRERWNEDNQVNRMI
jgi:isopentenyldiphosphate isomerase